MHRLGRGEHAKKSARCPFHDDKHNSYSIWKNDSGKWFWKCHAGCGEGDEITFLERHYGISNKEATKLYLEMAGSSGKVPLQSKRTLDCVVDWPACLNAFTDAKALTLALSRRYSIRFCRWLKENNLVGTYNDCIGFPVHDRAGRVIAIHYPLKDGSWRYYPQGAKTSPFVVGELLAGNPVHPFESYWDAFAFMDKSGERSGIIITRGASNGALVADEIPQGATVYVWTQNDAAGEKWQKDICANTKATVKRVKVPGPHKDLNDWTRAGATADDLLAAMKSAEVLCQSEAPLRPLRVEAPETRMDFKEWQTVISASFPTYARPAEICASVILQLLLNDVSNPFALALVDVPSSGKTITLNFFDVPHLAYTTDNFTPASFVSHASNVKREELANVDMLPRIRYRTLIVRDLAPIFGVKEDELLKTIGILTRALDGEGLETDSGVHGKRGYKGDWLFMLLAGTTPIPSRVFKVMGTLGSRLFFLALHSTTKTHNELIAQNRGTARREKERICREATDSFLRNLWAANPSGVEWDKNSDPEDCLRVIARCAELLAALRGTIQVWQSEHDGSVSHSIPLIEQPDRINCLLYNLARGHALLCGRTQLAAADLAPVLEVTFDSAPTIRSRVFRSLLEHNGTLKTGQVEKLLRCTKPTALKEMEALAVLGVAEKTEADPEYGRPEHELHLAEKFQWFATDECKGLRWP